METMSIGNEWYVSFDGQSVPHWEKQWVYFLVTHTVSENIEHVRGLDWFSLGQILGDDVWHFLLAKGEHSSAQRCFEYLIDSNEIQVEKVTNEFKATRSYKVIH